MAIPDDRRYSKEHEWALLEDDGTVLVGITEFAQHELGDVVYVELPKEGARVKQGDQIGEIESVKAVSDLYSPVSGDVLETNEALVDDLDTLSSSAFDAGWMMKIRVAEESTELLELAEYEKQLENEEE